MWRGTDRQTAVAMANIHHASASLTQNVTSKGKGRHTQLQHRQGAHFFHRLRYCTWIRPVMHDQCCRVPPPTDRYQIILLGDRYNGENNLPRVNTQQHPDRKSNLQSQDGYSTKPPKKVMYYYHLQFFVNGPATVELVHSRT